MTRKSKPPTNREMRAIAEHNVQEALIVRRGSFGAALRAYEDALGTPGMDQATLDVRREILVGQYNDINDQLGIFACKWFVDKYPDNDEPVKDEA